MEEMQQITIEQWLSWKEDIREKLRETAENFVYIGFRLKQIRDSGMFDGAADIFEFAKKEYGLGKSTTSRFIAINERFSEGGNSLELRWEYKALGSSKLSEMLTLTDAECQMITERTTVAEIREYKSFLSQPVPEEEDAPEETGEQPTAEESGGQQLAEGTSVQPEPESRGTLPEGSREGSQPEPEGSAGRMPLNQIQRCMEDFFRDRADVLNLVVPAVHEGQYKDASEWINPSGHCTHKKGICFLSMEDYSRGVKVKLLTEPSPRSMTWEELLDEIYAIYADIYESGVEDVHGAYYRKQKPVSDPPKEEKSPERLNAEAPVATSQQEEKAVAKELEPAEPREAPGKAEEKILRAAGAGEPVEEPLPGQAELSDYPGVVPEIPDASYEEIASVPMVAADMTDPVPEAGVSEPTETVPEADVSEPEETNLAAGMTEPAADVPGPAGMEHAADVAEPAAGEGKKSGPSAVDKSLAWMEFEIHLSYLKQWPVEWNYDIVPNASLRHAYQEAVGLAAALEKIMDMKGVSNV